MKKILFIIMAALTMVGCNGNDPKKNTGKVIITNSESFELSCSILIPNVKQVLEVYIPGNNKQEIELEVGKYEYQALGTTFSTMLRYCEGEFEVTKNSYTAIRLKTKSL